MHLRPGPHAQLEGPFGSFQLSEGSRPRADLDRRRHRHHAVPELGPQSGRLDTVDLYYCTPGAEQAHFLDELFDIADRYPAISRRSRSARARSGV